MAQLKDIMFLSWWDVGGGYGGHLTRQLSPKVGGVRMFTCVATLGIQQTAKVAKCIFHNGTN